MPLNPLDIQQKTFRVAIRGYAEDEVDDFLDEVVMTIRDYEQKLTAAGEEVETLRGRLDETRETEEALSKTLLAAQRTADQITEQARRESERLLSDARADASRITMEQGRERNLMLDELDRLREIVSDVKDRLSDIAADVTTQVDAVASDIDDAQIAYGRYEDGYVAPRSSAIDELRQEEDADDDFDERGGAQGTYENAWPDADDDDDEDDDDEEFSADLDDEDDDVDDADVDDADEDDADEDDDDLIDVRGEYDHAGALDDISRDEDDADEDDADEDDADEDDVDEDDVDDDDRDHGAYAESTQTSSARRPWERYDD